jgi:hypothetical protein
LETRNFACEPLKPGAVRYREAGADR